MSTSDHLFVFLNFWGLNSNNKYISVMFHSPFNPDIANSMSKSIEQFCPQHKLQFESTEDYPGSITYNVSGELTSWNKFGDFFRQEIIRIIANVQDSFSISIENITYEESYGIFDSGTIPQEYFEKNLHSTEPKLIPPEIPTQRTSKSLWGKFFS